jgi:hypothetical protein
VGALSNASIRILDLPFDAWRFGHFNATELAQPDVSGPDADPDHDGAANSHEFSSGTDPLDSASALRVRINTQTNTAFIQFTAGTNRAFTLQYRDLPASGAWQDLTNIAPATTIRTIVHSDPFPAGVTNRFYRVSAP